MQDHTHRIHSIQHPQSLKQILAWGRLYVHCRHAASSCFFPKYLLLICLFFRPDPKNCQTQYNHTSRHTVITLAHTRKCHPLPVTLSKPESQKRTPDFVPVPLIHGCFKGAARLKRACTLHSSPPFFSLPRRLANSGPLSCWNLNETGVDEKNCWRGAGDILIWHTRVYVCAEQHPAVRTGFGFSGINSCEVLQKTQKNKMLKVFFWLAPQHMHKID